MSPHYFIIQSLKKEKYKKRYKCYLYLGVNYRGNLYIISYLNLTNSIYPLLMQIDSHLSLEIRHAS